MVFDKFQTLCSPFLCPFFYIKMWVEEKTTEKLFCTTFLLLIDFSCHHIFCRQTKLVVWNFNVNIFIFDLLSSHSSFFARSSSAFKCCVGSRKYFFELFEQWTHTKIPLFFRLLRIISTSLFLE